VHGLGFSPDSKTVAVVCVGSNSVTLIESIGSAQIRKSEHFPQGFWRACASKRLSFRASYSQLEKT